VNQMTEEILFWGKTASFVGSWGSGGSKVGGFFMDQQIKNFNNDSISERGKSVETRGPEGSCT